jgi:hypothetical protein
MRLLDFGISKFILLLLSIHLAVKEEFVFANSPGFKYKYEDMHIQYTIRAYFFQKQEFRKR